MGADIFYPLCVVGVTCDRRTLFIDLAWGLNQAADEKSHSRPDTGEGRQTRNMSGKAVSQPSQASIKQRQRNIQQDLWTVLYFSVHQKTTETYKNKYIWTVIVLTGCN